MKRLTIYIVSLLLIVLSNQFCNAQSTDPEAPFGATNINAEVGNGGLSVGISAHGTITVLRWPSPSYFDQLNYKTATHGLTITSSARTLPHFGAADNMGSFAGLYFTAGMPVSGMVWLRDPTFTTQQYYDSPDSDVVVTRYTSVEAGIQVIQYDLVMTDRDVLVRHYVINNLNSSPIEKLSFVYYENMAPCLNKTIYIPTDDWANDSVNDYACLYDSINNELIHFMPGDQDFSHITTLFSNTPSQSDVNNFISTMSALPDGIYAVIGFDFIPDSYQVGNDATTLCPSGRGVSTSYVPQDAYVSAYSGKLPDSPAAQCQANAAVIKQFSLASKGQIEFTVYFSLAKDYNSAKTNLNYAQHLGWNAIYTNTNAWWTRWLSLARLPNVNDSRIINFSKRALITIKLATDNNTGAIVASISTQPPYAEDWPRDGSFINYALDVAGYHDMVTKHNIFYTKVQRQTTTTQGPAGSYDMNFYADGMPGGPIPFEIDETGLAVWSMWIHTQFLGSACERLHYAQQVWPAIKLGTQALVDCKDPTNNLQCYANEDDNPVETQGLQGAITTWLGIESGIHAARYLNKTEYIASWQARADQLKQAIIANFYTASASYTSNIGAASWTIWPAEFLPYTSTIMQNQSSYLLQQITPALTYQIPVIFYIGKTTLALATMFQNDTAELNLLDPLIHDLLYNLPTQDTQHMGEVAVVMYDANGNPYYQNEVAIPHVWEQSLSYLTLMARYNPQDFEPPYMLENPESCPSSSGCACSTDNNRSDLISLILSVIIVLVFLYIMKLNTRDIES
ncbi:MAG: hypothetical protein ACP5QW_06195 [bacterium]